MKIIVIGGASGSGKSTLARQLKQLLLESDVSAEIMELDRFYRELDAPNDHLGWEQYSSDEEHEQFKEREHLRRHLTRFQDYNFDHPAALDVDLILKCLYDLQGKTDGNNQQTQLPVYDFKTCKRVSTQTIQSPDVLIIEGILGLHLERLHREADLKIYVDAGLDTCLIRRIRRDTRERGRPVESVLDQYERFVKPAFLYHVQPSRSQADLIIPTDNITGNGYREAKLAEILKTLKLDT